MSLIKIVANDIELDFVRETLSIKIENTALSREFKVSHSVVPFLIIENKNTKLAIGTRDIASVKKNKTIPVVVFEGGKRFYGELQVLSYINGFRKCNLKYASSVLSIMNKKIAEFMPIVSVIPDESDPIPYTEKADEVIEGSEYWKTYPIPFLDHNYPTVKWQFPTMKWQDKFGVNLESDEPWFLYGDKINEYDDDGLVENKYTITDDICTVENRNVPSPQVFLLSPAFYALESVGFKLIGNFVENEFIKRLLLYSNKNNLTETNPTKEVENIILNTPTLGTQYDEDGTTILFYFYLSSNVIPTTVAGTYVFDYDFDEPLFGEVSGYIDRKMLEIFLFNEPINIVYTQYYDQAAQRYKGSVRIPVSEDQVGYNIIISYFSPINTFPTYTLRKRIIYDQVYFQMHPTIELGRYVPDWTLATYFNEIQKLFNLEINTDDLKKVIEINFNEQTVRNILPYIVRKSLSIKSYELAPYDAFLLKYDNDEDEALWITTQGTEVFETQVSDFLQNLSSKFKFIPTTFTAELSEGLDSKNGTGLMIYDPANKPYISNNYLGQILKMDGSKGIYQVFWKGWLKFLLNSSSVEMIGPFTETEKNKIIRLKSIFIDNQEYMIASVDCSETIQNNYILKFNLQSINF